MNPHSFTLLEAEMDYRERLQEAETYRLAKYAKEKEPGFPRRYEMFFTWMKRFRRLAETFILTGTIEGSPTDHVKREAMLYFPKRG